MNWILFVILMATAFALLLVGGITYAHDDFESGKHIAGIGGLMVLVIMALDMFTERNNRGSKNE